MNVKAVQIHQLSKKHLRQQINPECRYIRYQKSKSFITLPISITVHHKARKDYAIQRIGVGLARRSSRRSAQSFSCFVVYCDRNRWSDDENLLFFKLADAFQPIHHVNFICILPYLGFKDTSFANFASASHVFDNMRILLIKILHLQLALSIT